MRSGNDHLQFHISQRQRTLDRERHGPRQNITIVTLKQAHSDLPIRNGQVTLTFVDRGLVSVSGTIYSKRWLAQRLRGIEEREVIPRKQVAETVSARLARERAARRLEGKSLSDLERRMDLAIDAFRGRVVYAGRIHEIRYMLDAYFGTFLLWEELHIPQAWEPLKTGVIRAPLLPSNPTTWIAFHNPGDPTQLYTDALIDRRDLETNNRCLYRLSNGQGEDRDGRSIFPYPALRESGQDNTVEREAACNTSPFTADDFESGLIPGIPNQNFRQNFHYYYLMHAGRTALSEDARLYAFLPHRRSLAPQVRLADLPCNGIAYYSPASQTITFHRDASDRLPIFHEYGHFIHHTYVTDGPTPYGTCEEKGLTEGIADAIALILNVTASGSMYDAESLQPIYGNVKASCSDQDSPHQRGFAIAYVLRYLLANRQCVWPETGGFTSSGGGSFGGGSYTYDSVDSCEEVALVTDGVPSDAELAAMAKESFTFALHNTADRVDVTLHEFLQWMAYYYRLQAYDTQVLDPNEWAMLMLPFLDQNVSVQDFGFLFD